MTAVRHVLFVPHEELERHFASQSRQDVKVVVPVLLSAAKAAAWTAMGRNAKPETSLVGPRWRPTRDGTIPVCPSDAFALPAGGMPSGPFAISFAMPGAPQSRHVHERHWELYYGSDRLSLSYRLPGEHAWSTDVLERGGLALFGPGVEHEVTPSGLLLVVEVPSVQGDKAEVDAPLAP